MGLAVTGRPECSGGFAARCIVGLVKSPYQKNVHFSGYVFTSS